MEICHGSLCSYVHMGWLLWWCIGCIAEGGKGVTFLERELRKMLRFTRLCEDSTFVGPTCYVRVNKDVRMRIEFPNSSNSYHSLMMKMINRKEGLIDTNNLRFSDVWGEKDVSNTGYPGGKAYACIEERDSKFDWRLYHPDQSDYQILADTIDRYVGIFQDEEMLQGLQMTL